MIDCIENKIMRLWRKAYFRHFIIAGFCKLILICIIFVVKQVKTQANEASWEESHVTCTRAIFKDKEIFYFLLFWVKRYSILKVCSSQS